MNVEHGHDHNKIDLKHNDYSIDSELNVEWKVYPEKTIPNKDVEISITIKDKHGYSATSFAVVHEKQMHLLAISKDLSSFQHLHPEYRGEGQFVVKTQFPKAGSYRLFADFMPENGSQQLATFDIQTTGKEIKEMIIPDKEFNKTVNDLHFELKFKALTAHQHLQMAFTVKDANSMEPIELETYLGSAGHVVIVSEDLEIFLHVHPTDETSIEQTVSYTTSFPVPGIYKVWGQFKFKGNLYTVPFVIPVPHELI